MPSNLTIRDAQIEDLPTIVNIYNETIPSRMVTADLEPISVKSREQWFQEHSSGHRPLWVLEEEKTVLGWLSFQSFYGRPAYRATAEISIYLDSTTRGKGYGSMLLQKAIDHSPRLGVKTLLGFIFSHNQPSLRLFERNGFSRWGFLPRVAELEGIERDLVIVGRRIGERI